MNRVALGAMFGALAGCMPVHDVTLGADQTRIVTTDAGQDDQAQLDAGSASPGDAATDPPDGSDTGASTEMVAHAGDEAGASADASSVDAARPDAATVPTDAGDAASALGHADGGDAGKSPGDPDDHLHLP
jgi:hypothetical protein